MSKHVLITARWMWTVTLVLVAASGASAQRWDDLEQSLEGRQLVMRPTGEAGRKVYLDIGIPGAYALHRGDRLFPLRGSEVVTITDADPENDHIELELRSVRLGSGRVDFYGPTPTAGEFETWLDQIFEVSTPEPSFARFIGNTSSGVVHVHGANHLPGGDEREVFSTEGSAIDAGFNLCGVCFMPAPDVSDFGTEQSLALFSLQEVRSTYYPLVDVSGQERVERAGAQVLENWPVALKGYRYRFQAVDTDDVNAFAIPTGYVFVTRGLLDSLETDEELEAILAHEIAHVESRHGYRNWRNARNTSAILGIAAAFAGATDSAADDVITLMGTFAANLFLAGYGRDREREADLFAGLYLTDRQFGEEPLASAFRKLKFAQDRLDPFGDGGGGLFASHPELEERIERTSATVTQPFPDTEVFQGFNRSGALVATLRFDVQRLFLRQLDVIATLSTTAELGDDDNVNTIEIEVNGRDIELRERTAERIFPSDEVSAVFGNDGLGQLIEGQITAVELDLRNVDRWERVVP